MPNGSRFEQTQSWNLVQFILEHSSDIIFVVSREGNIQSISKKVAETLGFTGEEIIGKSLKEMVVASQDLKEIIERCEREDNHVIAELALRDKKEDLHPCKVAFSRLLNGDGQVVGFVGICSLMPPWSKFQQDLVYIDRLAETGRLAACIVHEINNPLAIILEITGWSQDLIKDLKGLDEEEREELETAIQHIRRQTDRCLDITRRILAFVRETPPEKVEVDIQELLKKTVDFLTYEIRFDNIKIFFDIPSEPIKLISDPKKLEQIFVNLITNAIHAVKEKKNVKGQIRIKVSKAPSAVEVSIIDNGIGIPKEIREKIFDFFFTTKPAGIGTGLGLGIVKKIVKSLGGDLYFESEVGVGTTFTVRLPERPV